MATLYIRVQGCGRFGAIMACLLQISRFVKNLFIEILERGEKMYRGKLWYTTRDFGKYACD